MGIYWRPISSCGASPSRPFPAPLPEALAGNLFSPARGLFVFVPLFLLSVYGACLKPEWPAARSLRPFLAGALVGHYLLICSFQTGRPATVTARGTSPTSCRCWSSF